VFSNETPAASGAAGKLSLMADDEDRMVATGPSLQGPGWGPDPDDDWLSGDVDWEETGETAAPGRAGRRGSAEAATMVSSPDGQAVSDVIRRRRMIALIAIVGAIILVVVIAMVATSGGSNAPQTTPVTTPAVTTPPATTSVTTTTSGSTTTPATTGSTTVTVPAAGPLKQGANGADVKTLQQALNAVGSASLTVDGNFGPATTQAVIAFQQANGLTADGVVGPATAKALNDALAQG